MYAHVFVCVAAMACLIYQTSKIQNRLCVLEVPPACRFQKVFYTPACAANWCTTSRTELDRTVTRAS